MKVFSLLASTTMVAIVAAQTTQMSDCTNAEFTNCLRTSFPTKLLTASDCLDTDCICSQLSLDIQCWKSHCPGDPISSFFGAVSMCGGATATKGTTKSTSMPAPTITSSGTSGTTTIAANTAASTSKGGAEGLNHVLPGGGILAVFIGVLANL